MLLKDSRGKPSWHFSLAIPTLIVGTVWFLAGGLDVTLPGGIHFVTTVKSGRLFSLHNTLAISNWGQRMDREA